jgi:hypothetical protein
VKVEESWRRYILLEYVKGARTANNIAEDTPYCASTVRSILRKEGLYKPFRETYIFNFCSTLTEEQIKQLRYLYTEKDRKDIANFLGIPYNSVGHVLKKLNINGKKERREIRIHKSKVAKWVNPFKVWNGESSYLLGYILGDGSLRYKALHHCPTLNISSKDLHILNSFSKMFGNPEVKEQRKGKYKWYTVDISDYQIVKCLENMGIQPNKSKVGGNITIPEGYEKDFLRGLFDSDGCVTKGNGGNTLVVNICGHSSYLSDFKIKYDFLNFTYRVRKSDGLAFLDLYRTSNIRTFYDYIYPNSDYLCLTRKKEVFDEYFKRR